jgi:hypothetical protein
LKQSVTIGPYGEGIVNSQTITLPNIPDTLIIYMKPTTYLANDADYYYPITNANIQFDNVAGILSSFGEDQLYDISTQNGLQMSYNQWKGSGKNANGVNVPLTGGPLVLKMGKDIPLATGLAPGINGNFTLQVNLTLQNNTANTITDVNVWFITLNSGFFQSMKGESRVIKSVITEQDVLDAPLANFVSRSEMVRAVGGFSFRNFLSNAVSKIPQVVGHLIQYGPKYHEAAKQVSGHVKEHLPRGAQSMLSAVGLGVNGAGPSGSGRSGGARKLSARLM